MILNEKKGNLFELDDKYALAHCISEDCAMGAGIAVEFQKRFKLKNDIREVLNLCEAFKYPITIAIHRGMNKRPIYNLITKRFYYNKPTYQSIRQCIKEMASMCKRDNIKYLAMPKIGCGLDRLQWSKVREIIKEEFKDLDIEIEVRYL